MIYGKSVIVNNIHLATLDSPLLPRILTHG